MKKLLIALFIALPITAYGASYTLTDANVTVNTNGVQVQCMPMSLNGTTYLPLRNVAEALGADVNYNNTTKQINLTTLDVNKLAESCVMLQVSGGQGSGVYIDYGTILTCDHVTRDMTSYQTSDGLKLVLQKGNKDIDASTLISPNTSIKPVKIGDSDEVKKDDKVVLITSPKGEKNKVVYANVIEINPNGKSSILIWGKLDQGSSGGACFNMQGELIGILSNGLNDVHFVIPINDIRKGL